MRPQKADLTTAPHRLKWSTSSTGKNTGRCSACDVRCIVTGAHGRRELWWYDGRKRLDARPAKCHAPAKNPAKKRGAP